MREATKETEGKPQKSKINAAERPEECQRHEREYCHHYQLQRVEAMTGG